VEPDVSGGQLVRVALATAGTEEPIGLLLRADAAPGAGLRALIACVRDAARARRSPG